MRMDSAIAILALSAAIVAGGDTPSTADYTEFSRLIHGLVLKQLPKEFEDRSGWGATIPIPPKLLLPNLRTYVKVGEQYELPHGSWHRLKSWMPRPADDLQIVVREFKPLDARTYRVVTDVDAKISCTAAWQQWQKGLMLAGLVGDADARVHASLVCDIGVALDLAKSPPELKLEPRITELRTALKEFRLTTLGDGAFADGINDKMKDVLQAVIILAQPQIKEQANLALVQGLRQAQGTISATAILKSLAASKAKR